MSSKISKVETSSNTQAKAIKRPKAVNAEGQAITKSRSYQTPESAHINTYSAGLKDSKGRAVQVSTAQWQGAEGTFHTQIIAVRDNIKQSSFPSVSHISQEEADSSLAKRLSAAIKYYTDRAQGSVFLTDSEKTKAAKSA